jgi:ABC-type sugar transport system ATPase subunit
VPAALRTATAAADGRDVIAGIRPEHVLAPGREARGEAVPVKAVVEIVETLGDACLVHARAGDDLLVYREEPHRHPEIGEQLTVRIQLSSLHLFDALTEARLA